MTVTRSNNAWRHALVCLLALMMGSCGCGEDVAGGGGGSSSETVIATLYKQDGTPAAGARVRVRDIDYLATPGSAGSSGFSYTLGTDGAVTLTGLQEGGYGIEVRDDDGNGAFIQAFFSEIEQGPGPYSYSDTLRPLGTVQGWIAAPDTGTVYARTYGLERLTAAVAPGQQEIVPFVLDSIPQGWYTVVATQDSLEAQQWVSVTAGQDASVDTLWLE